MTDLPPDGQPLVAVPSVGASPRTLEPMNRMVVVKPTVS